VALTTVLLLLATACSSLVTSTAQPFHPRIYAAVGDSYAAGEGLPPFEADSGRCHRSPSAYPRVVAAQEDSTLGFTACTGATVADLNGQLQSVGPATDLITITVGGNDAGFATVVGDCLIATEPCSRLDAQVETALTQLAPALEAAYGRVKARAPKARLLVVGYPQVVADPSKVDIDGCPAVATPLPGRRITADDARWLRQKGDRLTEMIRTAAKAAGGSYVDVAGDFAGHEACSTEPWLTGVVLVDLKASFHPTVAGQAELARLVTAALG